MAKTQEVRVRVEGEGRGQSWCEDSLLYENPQEWLKVVLKVFIYVNVVALKPLPIYIFLKIFSTFGFHTSCQKCITDIQ